jgi:hypothetical protein|tara:strand:+ start:1163 stop:1447 length:285 start_codon:yes stop_codon:yes gene_type:complete
MEVIIMIEFMFILLVTLAVLGPIALAACINADNQEKFIADTIHKTIAFCPYRFKWQIADDLSMRDDNAKFSYLMTMPKQQVKDLWMMEVHNIPT